MSSIPNNEFLETMILPTVFTKTFFVSFQISGESQYPLQDGLRLINEFEKCRTFMECLIADFIQFSSTIAEFLFLQGRLSTRLCVHSVL